MLHLAPFGLGSTVCQGGLRNWRVQKKGGRGSTNDSHTGSSISPPKWPREAGEVNKEKVYFSSKIMSV